LNRKSKERLIYVTFLVVLIVAIPTAWIELQPKPPSSNGCASSFIPSSLSNIIRPGYSLTCGAGSASDGRLKITVHNYYFAQAKDINFTPAPGIQLPGPDYVFLVMNVTIVNVGGGNVSVGGGWVAVMLNGSTYTGTASNFVNNATFSA